ncbi:MAG: ABC transporter substrate-binding protein [Heliobacteriaceae bacterium]|nr:ABC transporter substrate-binding protein [Heliobacteriaceae bacterium]MDD4587537.1 ABC transporter substrate-binding protein [Heliobacteriaceae bacterium]
MRRSKWQLAMACLLSVCLLVTVTGCGDTGTDAGKDAIKLGVILPLTGSEAMFGTMEKNAFEMAYEELKAAGKTTINGKEIKLVFEDDQGRQDVAKSATEKLVNQDKVALLSGGYSSACTNVIAGSAQTMNIPFVAVTGSADDITKKGWQWVFRGTAAPASKYTGALWDMMDNVIKSKTVAIIYENTDFGTSSAKGFRQECQKRGIQVVFDQHYESGAIDFKPMLANLKNTSPDLVFAVSYVMDAAMIVKQMKEIDFNSKFFVGGGAGYTMPEFKENAGDASEFVASTTLWVPGVTWPGAGDFFKKYTDKYTKEPDYHGAQAYATAYVLIDALNRAGDLSPAGIQKALKETDLMTVMGPIKFEDWEGYTNQTKPSTYVVQWQKGKLEVVWPEKVKSAAHVYPVPNWKER